MRDLILGGTFYRLGYLSAYLPVRFINCFSSTNPVSDIVFFFFTGSATSLLLVTKHCFPRRCSFCSFTKISIHPRPRSMHNSSHCCFLFTVHLLIFQLLNSKILPSLLSQLRGLASSLLGNPLVLIPPWPRAWALAIISSSLHY